jgi:hypothetical protein
MAVTVEALVIKDGDGVAIPNGVQFVDVIGSSTGPYAAAHVQLDATGTAIAAFGAGAVGATVQRVTLGSDDPAVALLGTAGGLVVNLGVNNDVTVTGTVDLGVTDNAVLDAIAASVAGTLTVGSHAVTNAGTFAVQVDGAALTALQLIDDVVFADDAAFTHATSKGIVAMGTYQSSPNALDDNDAGAILLDSSHRVVVAPGAAQVTDDAAFTPGTTPVIMVGFEADEVTTDSVDEGDGGAARMTLDRKVITTLQPHTAGGLLTFRSLDLDETEEDVKTSAGQVYMIRATNRTASPRYLKLYNDTAANVEVGTTTPQDTIEIPANANDHTVLMQSFGGHGVLFTTAICAAATTGLADADTGAPGTNDVVCTVYYK